MGDDFEARLGRMFSEAPVLPDAEAFAARVGARLDRGWMVRQAMIGVGGLAAGVIVAWQFVAGRFGEELNSVSERASVAVGDALNVATGGVDQMLALPASGETMWLAAGLAAVALAFGVTRAVENI